ADAAMTSVARKSRRTTAPAAAARTTAATSLRAVRKSRAGLRYEHSVSGYGRCVVELPVRVWSPRGLLAVGAIAAVGLLASSDANGAPSASVANFRAQAPSQYLSLPSGRAVSAPTTLLQSRLVLRRRGSVFVESDGAYAPLGEGAA